MKRTSVTLLNLMTMSFGLTCSYGFAQYSGGYWTVCSLGGGYMQPAVDMPPHPRIALEAQRAYNLLCPTHACGTLRVYLNEGVPNAAIFTDGGGHSIFRYSSSFMNRTLHQYGPGATFGIICHEIGHHIDSTHAGPQWLYQHSWSRELQADAMAGYALGLAGLNPDQLLASLQGISQYPNQSHPGWQQRWDAVNFGYQQATHRRLPTIPGY